MAGDWFDNGGRGNPVDVAEVCGSQPLDLMVQVVQHGAMVSMGTTSDGGALAVTVTLDGRWNRQYFRDHDELVGWLTEAVEVVATAPRQPAASPGGGQRSRRSRGA